MKAEKSPVRASLSRSPMSRSSPSKPTTPSSSLRYQSKETIDKLALQSLANAKRKRSPLSSPSSRHLQRCDTFASDYETGNSNRWTKNHWRKLEQYYLRKDRDVQKTANSFYYGESLKAISLPTVDDPTGRPITDELWSKEQILWRTNCLHTSVEYHGGLLPSQRKKKKASSNNIPSRSSSSLNTNDLA